jgi:hypothetical protein
MTNENTNPETATVPFFGPAFLFSGVSPEVWSAMTEERRQEFARALEERKQRAAEKGVADA